MKHQSKDQRRPLGVRNSQMILLSNLTLLYNLILGLTLGLQNLIHLNHYSDINLKHHDFHNIT